MDRSCSLYCISNEIYSDNGKDTQVLLDRLLLNQVDIGDQLKSIVGEDNGNNLTTLLEKHIELAGDVIKAAVANDQMLEEKIEIYLIMVIKLLFYYLHSMKINCLMK